MKAGLVGYQAVFDNVIIILELQAYIFYKRFFYLLRKYSQTIICLVDKTPDHPIHYRLIPF